MICFTSKSVPVLSIHQKTHSLIAEIKDMQQRLIGNNPKTNDFSTQVKSPQQQADIALRNVLENILGLPCNHTAKAYEEKIAGFIKAFRLAVIEKTEYQIMYHVEQKADWKQNWQNAMDKNGNCLFSSAGNFFYDPDSSFIPSLKRDTVVSLFILPKALFDKNGEYKDRCSLTDSRSFSCEPWVYEVNIRSLMFAFKPYENSPLENNALRESDLLSSFLDPAKALEPQLQVFKEGLCNLFIDASRNKPSFG